MKYWPGTNIPKSENNDFNWRGPCKLDWPRVPTQRATTDFMPFHRVIPAYMVHTPEKKQ